MPEPSVAITARIEYDLYQRALECKKKTGKSVNQMIGEALEEYLRVSRGIQIISGNAAKGEWKMRDMMRRLTDPYNDLTLEERVQACDDARQQGIDAAANERGSAGGIEDGCEIASPSDYYFNVVEPAFYEELIDEETCDRWDHRKVSAAKIEADPRYQAFAKAWAADMAQALADMRDE